MTNSSSRSDAALALGAAVLAAAAAATAFLSPWAAAATGLAASGAALAAARRAKRAATLPADPAAAEVAAELDDAARAVTRLLDGAFRGDLESRLQPTPASEPARSLAVAANDFLDVSDAFVREARASLDELAAGRHHRRFLTRGLAGAHARAATSITAATMTMGERATRFRDLTQAFEREVVSVSMDLSASAFGLRDTASALGSAVGGARRDAGEIEGRAGAVAESAASAAAAAEGIATAVSAVSRRAAASRDMAERASGEAEGARAGIEALLAGAGRISAAVGMIHAVSEQTNLLAINAMIEAARSGREGAGFAVVAREVQALAGQTREATTRIEADVKETLKAARGAASAIQRFHVALAEMARFAAETAADADGQSAAVGAVVDSVNAVSGEAAEMSRLVGAVSGAVGEASTNADAVRFAADGVLDRAENLAEHLNGYLGSASAV